MQQYIAVYISMQQYIAVCSSMQQYIAVYSSMQQYIAVCSSIQQYIAVYSSTKQYTAVYSSIEQDTADRCLSVTHSTTNVTATGRHAVSTAVQLCCHTSRRCIGGTEVQIHSFLTWH